MDAIKKDLVTYQNVSKFITSIQEKITSKTEEINTANKLIKTCTADLKGDSVELPEDCDANALITQYKEKQRDRVEAEGLVKQASEAYAALSERYHELQDRMSKNETRLKVAEELGDIKEILSKNGLPRVFVEKKFNILAKITAENLAILNSDFTVDIDEENFLSFVFDRYDGHEQVRLPMSKLSGGQKVRLCIAFLLAVQQELVTEVGFQTFDEPSTHLDEEGVDRLSTLFKKLQELLNTAEHQVWVCDHNPMLEDSFNKTLTLS